MDRPKKRAEAKSRQKMPDPPPTFAKRKMKQPNRVVPLIHEMGTSPVLYPNNHRFAVHSLH